MKNFESARRWRDQWITWILKHHVIVLVAALMLSGLAVWRASLLRVDSDLRDLLPEDHPVITSLSQVESSFGAIGSVNVVVVASHSEHRQAFANALAESLADHPMLNRVEHRVPNDFFVDHALYYLSDKEMETLSERVGAWQHYELCTAQPDVCVDEPDAKAPEKLKKFVQEKRSEAEKRSGFSDFFERDELDALVVFLRPTGPSSDLEFAVAVSDEMKAQVASIYEKGGVWTGSDLRFNVVGPYVAKADEHANVKSDMFVSGCVGLGGVVLVLLVLFRSWRALWTLLVPLTAGVAWSMGAAQLLLGHLNTMTSLIASVVMGMGIDAGIHFLSHARREYINHDTPEAIRRAFARLAGPLLMASMTTLGSFMVMSTSGFPAFREFGILAATGVVLCLLAMISVYPALLMLVGIKRTQKVERNRVGWLTRLIMSYPGSVFAGLVAITVLSAPLVQDVRKHGFESNGRLLQSDSARARTESDVFLISKIVGKDIHAGVLTVDSYEQLESLYRRSVQIHEQRQALGRTVVADLFAAPKLMPAPGIDLETRLEEITELGEYFSEPIWARLEGKELRNTGAEETEIGNDTQKGQAGTDSKSRIMNLESKGNLKDDFDKDSQHPISPESSEHRLSKEEVASLRRMLAAQPFSVEELPEAILSRLRGQDGKWAILAYPTFDAANIFKAVEFMNETENYLLSPDSSRVYVGESTVYAAMYVMMREEWPIILGMASVLISSVVFWQVRSISQTVVILLPLILSLWWLLAAMSVLGIKFSLFNVPILPAILGVGVDNAIYLGAGIRSSGGGLSEELSRNVDQTGRAIWAATSTTVVGFASFLVADSGGLRGIGFVAVLGIAIAALASVLVLPTLSVLVKRRQQSS